MTKLARAGIGAKIEYGDGESPEVFTEVAEVRNISGPQLSRNTSDATTLDSAGGFEETIPALKTGGQVTLPILWINSAAQQDVYDMFDDDDAINWRITLPTNPTTIFAFAANVTGINMDINPNEPMQAELTLTISGQVARTSGS